MPLLLKAWEKIDPNKAELIIAGFGTIPENVILQSNVHNFGLISKNNRPALYNKAHVFVFPSYFEGFAQVQIEAASSGLPVIGTYNSGAEELVEDGKEGFIVQAGDTGALCKAMNYFITNPSQIPVMGKAARAKAEQFTWDAYGKRWCDIIDKVNFK